MVNCLLNRILTVVEAITFSYSFHGIMMMHVVLKGFSYLLVSWLMNTDLQFSRNIDKLMSLPCTH